jgi:Ser/Thr protein kinase RdoA (MazF antagonist)
VAGRFGCRTQWSVEAVQTWVVTPSSGDDAPAAVITSVVTPATIARLLSRHWGLNIRRCYFWKQGQNDTYVVEATDRRWVARLYRHGACDESAIRYELELIDHLVSRGVPAVASMPTDGGDRWVSVTAAEGARPLVVFPMAEGVQPDLSNFPAAAYGRLIGALHRETDGFITAHPRPPLDFEALVTVPAKLAANWLEAGDAQLVNAAARALGTVLSPAVTDRLDWGPCHNDVIGNVVHGNDGEVRLFDFGSCGPGWRSLELATVLLQFDAWGKNSRTKDPAGLWANFVAGYEDERPLSDNDLGACQSFVAARYIWLLGLHVSMGDLEGHIRDSAYFPGLLEALARWLPGTEPPLDPVTTARPPS